MVSLGPIQGWFQVCWGLVWAIFRPGLKSIYIEFVYGLFGLGEHLFGVGLGFIQVWFRIYLDFL